MTVLFEKHCGKFYIAATEHFNGGKSTHCLVQYQYGAVTLKELNFPAEKKQVAIDIASHIADAVELYRDCIIAKIAMISSVI